MKQKGFTLVELLAVITLLGILAMLIIPSVNDILDSNKTRASKAQKGLIVEAAKKYSAEHLNELPTEESGVTYIQLDTLLNSEFLTKQDIVDPETDKIIEGCVKVTFERNQNIYNFINDNNCTN